MRVHCEDCQRSIELGGTVGANCDGCIRAYMKLRQQYAERSGKPPWPLAPWARKRCAEIGIEAT